jgi:hypothetical protein
MIQYFAYGANIGTAVMYARCPAASFSCIARLREHRFVINSRGVATVVPEPGATVYGALWALTTADTGRLDAYEGVPFSYLRNYLSVETERGLTADVLIYVATDCRPGVPRPRYLKTVLAGMTERGLPQSYQSEIAKWSNQ